MADISRPLVIADRFPLPAVTGGRQRMWNFLLAVNELGPADLLVLDTGDDATASLLLEHLPAWSVHFAPVPKRLRSVPGKLLQALRHRQPSGIARLNLAAVADDVRGLASHRDLIVAIQAPAAVLAQQVRSPASALLVDLWDIEDARLARIQAAQSRGRARLHARRVWSDLSNRGDIRAWRRFHQHLVETADAVTVCSDIDRSALPSSDRVRVVPNGADLRPRVERRMHEPPTILYHGQMSYPPNADAAQILTHDVLPKILASEPSVRVRIVGRADARVTRLQALPTVTVTGFVDDIEVELRAADILVVPLRVGGGTRLKILEAFAASLPVVSTAVGAEGLDVEHGTHLLIADQPDDMARAVLSLLHDDQRRNRMVIAAHSLVAARYDWRIIRAELADVLRELRAGR